MLLVMGVSLYTSRLTLDVLGVDDYGLYIVVGGVVSMLGFLNSSMAISVQRFLSFEMGKDNPENVRSIFNTSLLVHVFLAIIVVFLLETIGVWFVSHKLLIPDGREDAAMWVFQCVVITTALSIVMVPYSAMIMAKEKMDIYAYISIIDVVLKLLVLYLLLNISYDKLVIYAILLALQGVAMILINA
jgi:O-antigen/teichoic acid export membrane protein